MGILKQISVICLLFVLAGCADDSSESFQIFVQDFTFTQDMEGWTPGFTDYAVGETPEADSIYRWAASYTGVPGSPNAPAGVLMTCENVNGDIFMFLKKKIENLKPNTTYSIVFDIDVMTNATAGKGLILKAGGSDLEPKKVIEDGYYALNIDKGENIASGESLFSLGDIGGVSSSSDSFVLVNRGNANSYDSFEVSTSSKGELWLIVGTDCLSTGSYSVHYSRISIIFSAGG